MGNSFAPPTMFLQAQQPAPSNIPVLASVCVIAGLILGGFALAGSTKIRRHLRASISWISRQFHACVAWVNSHRRRRNDLAPRGLMPVLPTQAHVPESHEMASGTSFDLPLPVSPTSINCSIDCSIDDPPGYASMPEPVPVITVDEPSTPQATGCGSEPSSRCSSPSSVHAVAHAPDLGLWDGSVVPWGLIAASATPCASSVFETDSEKDENDMEEGENEGQEDGHAGVAHVKGDVHVKEEVPTLGD
ncbi:hypothetical protein AURDEDRAFT_177886 [Auricularia subglabra TFB-10046 SS5]|uniref:Uncharacterized protein n=1 Tax=Auricularia subglabra (strain TFB-10046 / SS5) TaxID=717982 RepID=J0L9J0_AURST|nr:hypothetical protein AURDEDRAFT_177886 [Auricularia subglabra TFB-10046 SS5]